ncbi:hypothetical protein [Flexivirga aerilata]|uniref:hypothetical protein n=1 Tax=Flexivirga aerilata TaxID=1656889 RepID=UPI001FE428E0|nr:hypothetical protein [Flexivirga aerilata]
MPLEHRLEGAAHQPVVAGEAVQQDERADRRSGCREVEVVDAGERQVEEGHDASIS